MAIGGICQSCKMYSPGLFTCHSCASKVCPNCVIMGTPFCKVCQGRKMMK